MTTSAPVGPTDADKAAVVALVQQVKAAWAAMDADAFADSFTEDGTMAIPGLFMNGREEIRTYAKEGFADQYKGTKIGGQPLGLRFLGSDVAVLLSEGGLLVTGESDVSDAQLIRACWTMVRQEGQWWLASYMNTPVNKARYV